MLFSITFLTFQLEVIDSFTTQNNVFSQTNYNPKYVLHFFPANAPTY